MLRAELRGTSQREGTESPVVRATSIMPASRPRSWEEFPITERMARTPGPAHPEVPAGAHLKLGRLSRRNPEEPRVRMPITLS